MCAALTAAPTARAKRTSIPGSLHNKGSGTLRTRPGRARSCLAGDSLLENALEGRLSLRTNVPNRHACRCCGFLTIEVPDNYEICPVCGWEDEGVDDPTSRTSTNTRLSKDGASVGVSLVEAQANFKAFRAYKPYLPSVRPARSDEQPAPGTPSALLNDPRFAISDASQYDRLGAPSLELGMLRLWASESSTEFRSAEADAGCFRVHCCTDDSDSHSWSVAIDDMKMSAEDLYQWSSRCDQLNRAFQEREQLTCADPRLKIAISISTLGQVRFSAHVLPPLVSGWLVFEYEREPQHLESLCSQLHALTARTWR